MPGRYRTCVVNGDSRNALLPFRLASGIARLLLSVAAAQGVEYCMYDDLCKQVAFYSYIQD